MEKNGNLNTPTSVITFEKAFVAQVWNDKIAWNFANFFVFEYGDLSSTHEAQNAFLYYFIFKLLLYLGFKINSNSFFSSHGFYVENDFDSHRKTFKRSYLHAYK